MSDRTGGAPDISGQSSTVGAVSAVVSHRTGGSLDISWPSSLIRSALLYYDTQGSAEEAEEEAEQRKGRREEE